MIEFWYLRQLSDHLKTEKSTSKNLNSKIKVNYLELIGFQI